MFSDFGSKLSKGMKGLGLTTSPSKKERELEAAKMKSPEDAACYVEWGLTLAEEDILIDQLKDEVELDVILNEFWDREMLRRFLRARKHDIAKAKEMILKTVDWRKETGADTIRKTFDFHEREEFHKNYPEGFFWTDCEGRPVYVQKPGDIDCSKLWKFTTMERSIKYHITQQERYVSEIAPAAAISGGSKCFQSTVLIDMEGVGVSTLTGEVRQIMGKVMSIDQDYYPELMHKALIINAPASFRVIWSLVKHLLDARTQDKIEVLPVDYKPVLHKYIDPKNLMRCYGGTNDAKLIDCPGPWNDPDVIKQVTEKRLAWEETLDTYKSALEEQCSDLSPSSSTHLEPKA